MRTAAEAALTRGRRAKAVLGVTSWLSATALSTAIAIGTFLFQQNREEQKKAPSRDLGRSAACNDADWVDRGALARSPEIVCQAWEFTAWRAASGYRVEAFARARGVNLMRTVVHPQGASSSAIRPVQGEDGPKASLSFWVCEVPSGAPFRLVAWSQPRGEIHAVAYVQEQGVPPC
jgi:hypothetical protein